MNVANYGTASNIAVGYNVDTAAAGSAISFGGANGSYDVSLFRSAANVLKTNDYFQAGGWIHAWQPTPANQVIIGYNASTGAAGPAITFGPSLDTSLYYGGANLLKTDDEFEISNGGGKDTLRLTSTAADTGLTIGGDTNLYRSAADQLKTDDTFDAAAYKVAGTSGASVTCSGGQFLQNQVVAGGITTGGTCASAGGGSGTLQDAYNNSSSPATILSSGTKDLIFNIASGSTAQFKVQGNGSDKFTVDNAGVLTLAGNQTTDITTAGNSTTGRLTVQPGNTTAAISGSGLTLQGGSNSTNVTATNIAAGNVTIQGGTQSGNGGSPQSAAGGSVSLVGGNATGGSGTRNGGAVTIDGGTGANANGNVSIGTTNAPTLALGRSGGTTTIAGGNSSTLTFGDTNLYRSGADNLKTDDTLTIGGSQVNFSGNGAEKFTCSTSRRTVR